MRMLHAVFALLAGEDGETSFFWSVGIVIMAGVIAIVIGPAVSSDWREFVGRPLP